MSRFSTLNAAGALRCLAICIEAHPTQPSCCTGLQECARLQQSHSITKQKGLLYSGSLLVAVAYKAAQLSTVIDFNLQPYSFQPYRPYRVQPDKHIPLTPSQVYHGTSTHNICISFTCRDAVAQTNSLRMGVPFQGRQASWCPAPDQKHAS